MSFRTSVLLTLSTLLTINVCSIQHVLAKQSHSHSSSAAANLSADQRAIDLVDKLQEVRDWKKAFGTKQFNPATDGRPGISVEGHHGSIYTVLVFEDKPDQILTFARYEVNLKTRSVTHAD